MIEITAEIRALIDKAAAGMELAGDEYIDPADGLIHCKKCGGQRQTVVPCFGKPDYFMPRCICQCQREAEEQRKAAEERQRRMERIKRRKAQGLQDRYLYDYTFANDNGKNPLMDKARAYVENWKEAYKNNTGLLLFGDVGTGKSFFAGCIANALLDQDWDIIINKPIDYQKNETKKLLYVVCSRAKKNLFLFSEQGRTTQKGAPLLSTDEILEIDYEYDSLEVN